MPKQLRATRYTYILLFVCLEYLHVTVFECLHIRANGSTPVVQGSGTDEATSKSDKIILHKRYSSLCTLSSELVKTAQAHSPVAGTLLKVFNGLFISCKCLNPRICVGITWISIFLKLLIDRNAPLVFIQCRAPSTQGDVSSEKTL